MEIMVCLMGFFPFCSAESRHSEIWTLLASDSHCLLLDWGFCPPRGFRFHRETVRKGAIVPDYVLTNLKVLDFLMKPHAKQKLNISREKFALVENNFPAKRKCYFFVSQRCSPREGA